MNRFAAVGLLAAAGTILLAGPATAHPNDEVLQQVYLTPDAERLTIQVDLTPGVLVSPRFAGTLDTNDDGTLSQNEIDSHVDSVHSVLHAEADGQTLALAVTDRRYPPLDLLAAGGGTITLTLSAPLPTKADRLTVTDDYEPGAKTIVQMSVLSAADPIDLGPITHADNGRTVGVALHRVAGTGTTVAAPAGAASGSSMLDTLRRPLTSPWALVVLVGACALLGALHALTPGHGKTLLAAYLVGEQGTATHAITLGVVITFTHTAAVLALGGAVLLLGHHVLPGVIVPVLTIVSGALVLVLGLRLLRTRWKNRAHGHGHSHGHGPATSLRRVTAMGMSAGMIPCPEALSVMLLAIGLNRTALGLVMIVAFSVGLAAVLVGLGLVLVTAAPTATRLTRGRPQWMTRRIPLVSAAVVTALGGVITVTGFLNLS